jgi:hypothetical protein
MAELVNLFPEQNNNGSFRSVRRCEGLTLFAKLSTTTVRSNFIIFGDLLFVVAGPDLFSISDLGEVTNLGVIGGGTTIAVLRQNAAPTTPQILILNGLGDGFIFTTADGISAITDPSFLGSTGGDILNEAFILARSDSTEFFLSDPGDGSSYEPLAFGSAEQSPDDLVTVVAKKSSAWMMGTKTIEKWQTFASDPLLPIRFQQGASIERGVIAPDSVARLDDYIAWLADDGTVRMIQGSQMIKISDLDLELRIRGNGTAAFPGFTDITDAVGWWVDGPIHKIYYLTFPAGQYTWGFDLTTGQTHTRQTESDSVWQGTQSILFDGRILVGSTQGDIFELDPANRTENDEVMRTSITTPSMMWDQNVTIPLIELDMEVGILDDLSLDPQLMVSYTKDGIRFTNWGTISLGTIGASRTRVPMRFFGQVVRNKNFALRFETTDAVEVRYYGLKASIEMSVL